MENIKYAIKDGKLFLEIDLEHTEPGQTKTGKKMCATSSNWARIPELGNAFSFNMVLVRNPEIGVPRVDVNRGVEFPEK